VNRARFALHLLITAAGLGILNTPGASAQPIPVGPETRVDTIGSRQLLAAPVLALQPGGDFEIGWNYLSTTPPFVSVRHFAADGRPTDAGEVPVDQGPFPARLYTVTATPEGFEVLWQTGGLPYLTNYWRHLNLQGLPDFSVPPVRLGVAPNILWVWQVEGHGFVGGWQSKNSSLFPGIAAQRLSPTGRLTGAVLRLSSRPVSVDDQPILTEVADGGLLAVWDGIAPDFSWVLRARRLSPAGIPQGADFDLNTIVPGPKDFLSGIQVATAPDGGFAVSWSIYSDRTQVITPYLRFFDASGRPLGAEIPGPATNVIESIAFDGAGNLLVLWSVDRGTSGPDLEIQLLDRNGMPQGAKERVASAASRRFRQPTSGSIAWSGSTWIITWTAQVSPHQGPNAVFVRRFAG